MNDPAQREAFNWEIFLHNIDTFVVEEGSQEAFCVAVGLSFWTLNGWRQGRYTEPKHGTLQAIADHYDMTVDDLTGKRLPRGWSKP